VVAEPTANYPYTRASRGSKSNARRDGAAPPDLGDNAIVKMAHVMTTRAFPLSPESHAVMGKPPQRGPSRGLNTNSVPDEARITLDTRTVPGIDHGHLCKSLATLLAPRGATVRQIVDCAPLYTEPADEWVQHVFEACTPFLDARPVPKTITFSTDGADLKRGYGGKIPAVVLGPGEPKLAHQTDEWCSTTRIEQSVDLFATLMRDWCSA
jgi:succinyl-diaminopimelate desuccinylase